MAIRARGAKFTPTIVAKDSSGRPIWKNLDKLKETIQPYSFTCRLEDCTDLPPTIYESMMYELEPKQRKMYEELKKLARVELEDDTVTVLHKMTMLLRLQQIVGGFLPTDNGEMHSIFAKAEDNPRVQALMTLIESLEAEEEQAIIWCRFTAEIKMIEKLLGEKCFSLFGETKNRESVKDRFMAGERPFLVANVAVGGTGLDFSGLYTMVYYSNDFNFGNRDQSEARPLHIGQNRSLLIVDLEAEDTIDKQIVNAMKAKRDVSVEMMKF
jgi:SNF2 family DNA or RNA helicase